MTSHKATIRLQGVEVREDNLDTFWSEIPTLAYRDIALINLAGGAPEHLVIRLLETGVHHHVDEIDFNRAFRRAAWARRLAVATAFLDHGADVHDGQDAALQIACSNGDLPMAALLLDRGADLHVHHDRVFHLCAEAMEFKMLPFLIERGISPRVAEDWMNENPEHPSAAFIATLLLHNQLEVALAEESPAPTRRAPSAHRNVI